MDTEIRRGFMCLLGNVRKAVGVENKLIVVTHLFQHFCQHTDVRDFIGRHHALREAIRKKLKDLFFREEIQQAEDWYTNIFQEELVPDSVPSICKD